MTFPPLPPRITQAFILYGIPVDCLAAAMLAAWPWWTWEPAAARYSLAALYVTASVVAYVFPRVLAGQADTHLIRGEKQ